MQLGEDRPEHLGDIGRNWASDLPQPVASTGIAQYQLLICKYWGRFDIFQTQIFTQVRDIGDVLPDEIARQYEEIEPGGRDDDGDGRGSLEKLEGVWQWVGELLESLVCVPMVNGDKSREALRDVVAAIEGVWRLTAEHLQGWEKQVIAEHLLEVIVDAGENALPAPVAVANPIIDLIRLMISEAGLEGELLGAEAGSNKVEMGIGDDDRLSLQLRLAARLYKVLPEWSEAGLANARSVWERLLVREPTYSGGLNGTAAIFASILVPLFKPGSRGLREETLFRLTQGMVSLYLSDLASAPRLTELQSILSQIEDADIRSPLLAVVATGWLRFGELNRATSLAQVVDSRSLAKAGFYDELCSLIERKDTSFSAEQLIPSCHSWSMSSC